MCIWLCFCTFVAPDDALAELVFTILWLKKDKISVIFRHHYRSELRRCDLSSVNDDFRRDINGLRAWAVVAVVLFHFGVPGFSGGYVGVDVFFVISGYLMTAIIVGKLLAEKDLSSQTRFDLFGFYLARARRILPALLVLCAVLLSIGWFYVSPDDYKALANHALRAVVFVSNLRFLREAGYFDVASHEKLLLHTWSLSVEWQFYIFFPVILMMAWKILPKRQVFGLVVLFAFLLSLIYSQYLAMTNPSAAFYLLSSRAWEMLAGALVFLYGKNLVLGQRFSSMAEVAGFALIVISVVFYTQATAWPGLNALLPVLGAVLVLLAAKQNSLLSGLEITQWLGKTSYSLYLWHWPFSVALFYLGLQGEPLWIILAILCSVLFGWLSWFVVEQPSRNFLISRGNNKQVFIIFFALLVVIFPAYSIKESDGVQGRFDEYVNLIFAQSLNKNPRKSECHVDLHEVVPECKYGGNELGVIVLGDSHAQSVIRSVEKSMHNGSYHVLDWTLSGCPSIFGVKSIGKKNMFRCGDFVLSASFRLRSIDSKIPLLIVNRLSDHIVGYTEKSMMHLNKIPQTYVTQPHSERDEDFYAEMANGIVETACAFAQHRPVYMLRPIPEMTEDVPRIMGRAALRGDSVRVSISLEEYHERHKVAWAAQDRAAAECGVKILDPLPYLCSDGRCWGDVDGLPIYYDDDHLSERGGQLLIPLFRQMFN